MIRGRAIDNRVQLVARRKRHEQLVKEAIELREAGAVKLILYANQSNIIREDQVTGKAFIEMEYDVSSATGSGLYMLQLITAQGQSTYKVMINK